MPPDEFTRPEVAEVLIEAYRGSCMGGSWQFAGLLVGLLVGLTGMGGGSLMTPLLIFLFGFNPSGRDRHRHPPRRVFKTVGAVRHRTLGNVHARLSAWMFLASAPMSLVGVWLATWIKDHYGDSTDSLLGVVLGALVAGGLGLLAKSVIRHTERPDAPFLLEKKHRWAAVTIGFFGGLIVGLTSVGTGVFFGLSLLVLFPLRAAIVVGRTSSTLPHCCGLPGWVTSWRGTSTSPPRAGSSSAPFPACSSAVSSR